jgi:hypothetical protein
LSADGHAKAMSLAVTLINAMNDNKGKGGKTEEFVRNVLQEAEHFRVIIRVGEQQPRG